jgi:hypothetical protein
MASRGTDEAISASDVWGYTPRSLTDKADFTIAGTKTVLDDLNDLSLADIEASTVLAKEATLTAIEGVGWTNETLKAIKDAIDSSGVDVTGIEDKIKASPSIDSIFFKSGGSVCPSGKSIWDALGDGTHSVSEIYSFLSGYLDQSVKTTASPSFYKLNISLEHAGDTAIEVKRGATTDFKFYEAGMSYKPTIQLGADVNLYRDIDPIYSAACLKTDNRLVATDVIINYHGATDYLALLHRDTNKFGFWDGTRYVILQMF